MGRAVVQSILALLLASALSHNSNGEANAAGQIEHTKQLDEYQVSLVENSIARIIRDAKIKSGRNGKNKKKADKERNKSRNTKKNMTKNKKKMGRNRKNRRKLKNKGKKNKKQLSKTMKIRTKKGKKSRNKNNKLKKENKKPRQNKKKSRQRQKSKQNKKKLRTTGGKIFQGKKNKNDLSKWKPKQACDEVALCQKIKDYIKISNQLRKVRRILKSCDTMDRKAKKSASEFEATVGALETAIGSSSGRRMYRSRWRRASGADDVTSIKDKLKNCSVTVKAKCQKSSVAPCQEEANLTKCELELQGWLTKFGPSKGSCLQESADCCACITALPDVSKDCLAFDKKSTLAVESKKKCTGGDEEGSFGFCRKLQIEAAEKGPKHAKDNCKHPGPGSMTTKGPWPIVKPCGECSNTLECPSTCPFCDIDPGTNPLGFGKCYKFPVTSLTSTYTPCSKCPDCGNATSSGCDKKCTGNMTCCAGNDPVGECGCCIPKGTHCNPGKGGTCSQIATALVTASNPSCVNGVCTGESKCCRDVCCPLNWYCGCWGCWNPAWGIGPVCPDSCGECSNTLECPLNCSNCVVNPPPNPFGIGKCYGLTGSCRGKSCGGTGFEETKPCQTLSTPHYNITIINAFKLFELKCSSISTGKITYLLNGFQLERDNDLKYYYSYKCCPAKAVPLITVDSTPHIDFDPLSTSVADFTKNNVTCKPEDVGDPVMQDFQMTSSLPSKPYEMWYKLECAYYLGVECTTYQTPEVLAPGLAFSFLSYHKLKIQCPIAIPYHTKLSQFQLNKITKDKEDYIYYSYRCCKEEND